MKWMLGFLLLPLGAHDLYLKPAKWLTGAGEAIKLEYHNGDAFPVSEHAVCSRA